MLYFLKYIINNILYFVNISRECVYLRRRRNIVGEATSFVRSTTLFAEGNLVLCSLIENDVLTSLEMMLTASGQTMLCPADTNTKRKHFPKGSVFFLCLCNENQTPKFAYLMQIIFLRLRIYYLFIYLSCLDNLSRIDLTRSSSCALSKSISRICNALFIYTGLSSVS